MINTIQSISKQELVPSTLPDGVYNGLMSGFTVRIMIDKDIYYLDTRIGMKGTNINVIVKIKDNQGTVEFLPN